MDLPAVCEPTGVGPGFWSCLPAPLVQRIFSDLPNSSLPAVRLACRDWKFMLSESRRRLTISPPGGGIGFDQVLPSFIFPGLLQLTFNRAGMAPLPEALGALLCSHRSLRSLAMPAFTADWELQQVSNHLSALESLDLRAQAGSGTYNIVTDGGFGALSCLTSLRCLRLRGCKSVSDKGLAELHTLSHLTELDLCESGVSAAGLAPLSSALQELTVLGLAGCHVDDDGLSVLALLPSLTSLNLAGRRGCLSDCGLQRLCPLTRLQQLDISHRWIRVCDTGLSTLGTFSSRLETLNMRKCLIKGEGGRRLKISNWLQLLPRLPSLTSLSLASFSSVHDSHMTTFRRLMNLRDLDLSYSSHLTDRGLLSLSVLGGLQSLQLKGCGNLSYRSLEGLEPITGLQKLGISFCPRMTDAALSSAAKFPELACLDLSCCDNVTDQGLQHLRGSAALTSVRAFCCNHVSSRALVELQQALGPQAAVQWRLDAE